MTFESPRFAYKPVVSLYLTQLIKINASKAPRLTISALGLLPQGKIDSIGAFQGINQYQLSLSRIDKLNQLFSRNIGGCK